MQENILYVLSLFDVHVLHQPVQSLLQPLVIGHFGRARYNCPLSRGDVVDLQ